jgi:hypothetical protein
MTEFKGTRTLSKKKYFELEHELKAFLGDSQSEAVMKKIRDVLKFDPAVSVYNERMKETTYRRREKLKEAGISTYVSAGTKSQYYKNRESAEGI